MEEQNDSRKLIDDLQTFRWLKVEYILLVVAIAIGVLSYIFNGVLNDTTGLFGRSGSLLVLLAVINEYRLRTLRDRQLAYIEPDIVRMSSEEVRKIFRPKVFLSQKVITWLSHLLAIIGTIIWGFGDLLVQ